MVQGWKNREYSTYKIHDTLWSKKKDLVQGQAQLGFEPGTPDC